MTRELGFDDNTLTLEGQKYRSPHQWNQQWDMNCFWRAPKMIPEDFRATPNY